MSLTIQDVQAAARRLLNRIHRTPVISSQSFDDATGLQVFFKCENLQRAGAFKIRGALNKLLALTDAERARGVVGFSSGNHAQGVALAARMVGTTAIICMPTDAPALKVEATRNYGAEIVTYDRLKEDREAIARAIVADTGRVLVPLRKGARVAIDPPPTIADGIRSTVPGELTFPILRRTLTDIVLVSDDD